MSDRYTLPAGTACLTYTPGTGDGWLPFTTAEELRFPTYGTTDNGGYWMLQEPTGRLYKVLPSLVVGRRETVDVRKGRTSKGKGITRQRHSR